MKPRTIVRLTDKTIPSCPLVPALLDVACARGAQRAKLLRGTGIFESDLSLQVKISAQQLLTLIANVDEQSGRQHDCAFQVGRMLATSHLHGLWLGLGNSRNLNDALRIASCFQNSLLPLVTLRRFNGAGTTQFVIQDAVGCAKQWRFVTEMVLALIVALARYWLKQKLPITFNLDYDKPKRWYDYEEHLGFRLNFAQPLLCISVPTSQLSCELQAADTFLRKGVIEYYRANDFKGTTLPQTIRNLAIQNGPITLEWVANELGYSQATLKRKLKEHKFVFKSLVDEVQRQHAIFLLREQKLSNEQSAFHLAIDDMTNFRRAVKRWTGLTPSELRSL